MKDIKNMTPEELAEEISRKSTDLIDLINGLTKVDEDSLTEMDVDTVIEKLKKGETNIKGSLDTLLKARKKVSKF
jgi:hypothetical protein